MIIDGLKLLIIGMGTVFLFLAILVGAIKLLVYANRLSIPKRVPRRERLRLDRNRLVALLSAAVAAYEADETGK